MDIENGRYPARPIKAEIGEGGTKAGPPVVVTFEFLDEDMNGKTISAWLYFSEASAKYSIEKLRNCGWTGNELDMISFPDDARVDLVIEQEEYDGKLRPRIKSIYRQGVQVKRLPDDQARIFAMKMKGQFDAYDAQQAKSAGGKPATKSPQPAPRKQPLKSSLMGDPPPFDEEDIPSFMDP